jgi:hypothetical protein
MTVTELIEKLVDLPPDLPVRYHDYEGGPTNIEWVQTDYDYYENQPKLRQAEPTYVVIAG